MSFLSSTVLIHVDAGHFNGIGTIGSKKSARAAIKKYNTEGNSELPFISPQSIRRYIREYLELKYNQPNYYDRVLRKTTKSDFIIVDPITYFEDDFFGYSHPLYQNPNKNADVPRLKTASMNRRSPFLTNGYIGVPNFSNISISEGWVHPSIGTPLPYKAEFSSGFFSSSFTLECNRIGRFENYSDIIEMDPYLIQKHENNLIHKKEHELNSYVLSNQQERIRTAKEFYFEAIMNLFGGAKSTMFSEALHPKILISSELNCSNPLPSNLFKSESNTIDINWDLLTTFLEEWGSKFISPLVIGYRNKTLSYEEEKYLLNQNGSSIHGVRIHITTPGQVSNIINGGSKNDT